VEVAGIAAPVTIARDAWGIPHISAASRDDLFFAQGFVQAQDRLFQMDVWRRSVQGRLSEVLGPNFIERDAMTRRVQYRGDMHAEWASYGPDVRAIADAFARGVNAWVTRALPDLPEEFRLAGWVPEPWRAEDLLNRTDAFLASGDAQAEILRAQLVAHVGPTRAGVLFPSRHGGTSAAPGLDLSTISPTVGEILRRVGTAPFFSGFAAPFEAGRGSNAWAVARGPWGGPWLAVDPHRPLRNPSVRYLVHLRAPGWHMAGATSPWMPGVAIGHNEQIAWGMTTAPLDSQDVYVEQLNPANPRQVRSAGGWIDLTVRTDAVAVKGRVEPYEYEQLFSPRGVIIALDRERDRAYAVRWSGAEPGGASELAALALNRATSWDEFRVALTRWKMPTAEFVYADVNGRVERHMAGLAPKRTGWNGTLPVPGDRRFEWSGWMDHDIRTSASAAGSDFVASANDSEARLSRIIEVLADHRSRSVERMERLQWDVQALRARRLVPLLARVKTDHPAAEDARQRLLSWDGQVTATSREGALYVAWEQELIWRVAGERIPAALVPEVASRASAAVVSALLEPTRRWFARVPQDRDRIVLEALLAAVDKVGRVDRALGRTGGRSIAFRHPLAISEAARQRFNVGPFVLPGYAETVLSIGGTEDRPVGASFRAVFDLSNWDRSRVINAPGQSGDPASAHFADLARPWANGESVPFAFSEEAVAAAARETLTLVPCCTGP
jgi:penicillin amidase